MAHYVIEGSSLASLTLAGESAHLDLSPLMRGRRLEKPLERICEFLLQPSNLDEPPPFIDQCRAPVMREDMVDMLRQNGIDNLETFPASIVHGKTERIWTNYFVINVVGLVSAVDEEQSDIWIKDNQVHFIDELTINQQAADPHDFFRLLEAPFLLVSSDKVKQAVEQAGFEQITFYGPQEWSG